MSNGLFAVFRGSNCRKLPAAAFLGLTKVFSPFLRAIAFIFSKPFFGIKTSPRTSNLSDNFLFLRNRNGIDLIVRIFSVISSPVSPSPRVAPRTNTPFS